MLSIDKKQIMMEHFQRITYISNVRISVVMKEMQVDIMGDGLQVLALGKDEILIEGHFSGLTFYYDE